MKLDTTTSKTRSYDGLFGAIRLSVSLIRLINSKDQQKAVKFGEMIKDCYEPSERPYRVAFKSATALATNPKSNWDSKIMAIKLIAGLKGVTHQEVECLVN